VRFENDGLFADEKLNQSHWAPDSEFDAVLIKSGKRKVQMESWHELLEARGGLDTSAGALLAEKRPRLAVLRKEPADYLFYRMVWSETRTSITTIIPSVGQPTSGSPVKNAGDLSWEEPLPAAEPKANHRAAPPR
jgi:hypothetical protein